MSGFNHNRYTFQSGSGSSGGGTIPMPTYKPTNEVVRVGGAATTVASTPSPLNSEHDLVSYIAGQLPAGVNPNHVLLGLGISFAGLVGGLIFWKSGNKPRDHFTTTGVRKRNQPLEAAIGLKRSKEKLSRGQSRISIPERVLILHQCPRGRKTPCIAPYPLKLETFLRMYRIKYEIDIDGTIAHPNVESGSKAEGITKEGDLLIVDLAETQDAQNCVKFVCEQCNIDPQKNLDERQKSLERAFLHLLQHHIYWGISLYRWVYDGARSLEKIQYLPPATMASITNVCRTVEQAAWFHGIGKKAPAEVVEDIIRDLDSMSRLLGEKKYFLSDTQPTELDCTAFAMLAQMYWTMDESPYYTAVTSTYKNLAEFCERIKKEFWPDWEQCLNNSPVSEA